MGRRGRPQPGDAAGAGSPGGHGRCDGGLVGRVLGLHPGGRNWLPVSVVGLLYGAQYVRVGIEDLFFLWPHRNDIPTKTSQTVQMIVDLCKVLGREVATVVEARQILGIKRTS